MLAGLTDEQQHIKSEARRRLEAERDEGLLLTLLETPGAYDEKFWASARDMGWPAIAVPEENDGLGLSIAEACIVAEETGRVTAGAPFMQTSMGVADALTRYGSQEQKDAWLAKLASGEAIGAFAAAEGPGLLLPVEPTVRFADGTLTGRKTTVVGGAAAHVAIVFATDATGAPLLALVDLSGPGVTRTNTPTFDATRMLADITFDGTPAELAPVNDAKAAAERVLATLALVIAFEQIGGADRCMEIARDYAKDRRAFGQPIGAFQSIKHRIAEMYVRNQIARGNAIAAVTAALEGAPDANVRAAAARLAASDAYDFAAREMMQVHGAIGITWEAGLHLHYRRARALALELGAAPEWEARIVAHLTASADA